MNPNVSPSADLASSASSSHERHAQRRRVEIFCRRLLTAAITGLGGSVTRRIQAMQARLVMKMVPCMGVTLVIAHWNGTLLGTARLQTTVITFAWAAAVVHQFLASRPTKPVQRFGSSPDLDPECSRGADPLGIAAPGTARSSWRLVFRAADHTASPHRDRRDFGPLLDGAPVRDAPVYPQRRGALFGIGWACALRQLLSSLGTPDICSGRMRFGHRSVGQANQMGGDDA